MKKNLSIAFGIESTYVALIENQQQGLALKFAGVTSQALDLENFDSPVNKDALEELMRLINHIDQAYDFVNVSIPVETTLVSKFPGRPNITAKEALSIVNIEIRQLYPQYNPNDFPTYLVRLPEINKTPFYLAVIIPKKIYQNIKKITGSINKLVEKIEISQFNAHYTLLYNYPDFFDKNVALFNIQENFIDFSSIRGKELLSYDLLKFSDSFEIPEIIKGSIIAKISEIATKFDGVFLFGSGLNREMLNLITNTISSEVPQVKRLNAFRLVRGNVDSQTREFCSVMAHLFPPCVGASIPSYHEKIKIF